MFTELEYMEAICSWNETWEVGKDDPECYKQFCRDPSLTLLNTFSTDDWCPWGITIKKANETHKWDKNHKMDAAQRLAAERLCRWNSIGEGYSLDTVECYAIACANPNTTVNQLYNYDFQWADTDPMTTLETNTRYPCKAGAMMVDENLWWKEDAVDFVDVYCGLDGEYQYPDPWLPCVPGNVDHRRLH